MKLTVGSSFDWKSYLAKPDFFAASVSCFPHVPLSRSWDAITASILVEVKSPDCTTCCTITPCCYWIAAVIKVSANLHVCHVWCPVRRKMVFWGPFAFPLAHTSFVWRRLVAWGYLCVPFGPRFTVDRVSAADKDCRVYPLDPRPDAVALYSGCTLR
ncbi:hypothetical protein TNCV_560791 [Trichonephila clavipes]|nr:hypothetical protein TNCV_560791 [Trichonephila clavipes]